MLGLGMWRDLRQFPPLKRREGKAGSDKHRAMQQKKGGTVGLDEALQPDGKVRVHIHRPRIW